MAHAIEMFFDLDTDRAVRAWWRQLSAIRLPSLETHTHQQRKPHVSLTVMLFQPEAWGRRYAREAVGAVLAWALHEVGLSRVIAVTQSANLRSMTLLRRVGLSPTREIVEHGERQTVLAATSDQARLPADLSEEF